MTFDAAEKHQSQIPALQLLVALGFTPLSQADAVGTVAAVCATWCSTTSLPTSF
jgi:hypothetical protein